MRNKSSLSLLFALTVSLAAFGCKKKPPEGSGTIEGGAAKPDISERIPSEPTPTTPDIDPDEVNPSDLPGGKSALGDVYFDFDRYEIRPDQRAALEANARWLLANPQFKVTVEGHCDERGTDEYNLALGDHRAKAASDYLQHLGVRSERISTISYGEAYPVDPGHSEAAWGKNRRAHFVPVAPGTVR